MPGSNAYPARFGTPGEQKGLAFEIVPNGATGVSMAPNSGAIKAARTGTGDITITFDDNYPTLDYFNARVGNVLANDIRNGVYTFRPAGGGPSTLTISSFADGTAAAAKADIAAGLNNNIKCFAVVSTTNKKI
jgi:hypothetical protein